MRHPLPEPTARRRRTGTELASRLQARIERALRPMTSKLAPAERRRLQTLLDRMLDPHQP